MLEVSGMRDLYLPKCQTAVHSNMLLEGLNNLREQGVLIDITIHVHNCEYTAHKVVLSACSDYFKAMFNQNMLESQNNSVTLYDVSQIGFKLLLNYMYTSQLELTAENIQDVLEVAVYLQMHHVVNKCSDYLGNNLNKDNCVDIVKTAETYFLKKLRTAAYTYICSNLSVITKHHELRNLSPEHMENILKFDLPVDCTEADVLYFIFKWLFIGTNEEASERLLYIPNILKRVRYEQITQSRIDQILEDTFARFGNQVHNIPLYKAALKHISAIPLVGTNLTCSTFNSRGMEAALIKIGGFGKIGVTNEINFCFCNERHWNFLTTIPHVEQCNFGSAVLNNNLYIIGGCFNQLLQEIIHPYGFKYNPRLDVWTKVPVMKTDRCRFTLNACDGKLYAIGGVTEFEHYAEYTNTCECFDPNNDTWEFIDPLPDYRSQHAAAVVPIRGVNRLYVSGGVYRENVMNTLYYFDTKLKTWQTCKPMLRHRADHYMFAFGIKLYVCGGWYEDYGMNRMVRQVDTFDVYDCLSDTWEVITRVPSPRHHAGIVAHEGRIYIVGGFTEDSVFHKDVAPVECYDIMLDTWIFNDKNAQEYWEHSCATLYIPKNRDPKYKNQLI